MDKIRIGLEFWVLQETLKIEQPIQYPRDKTIRTSSNREHLIFGLSNETTTANEFKTASNPKMTTIASPAGGVNTRAKVANKVVVKPIIDQKHTLEATWTS